MQKKIKTKLSGMELVLSETIIVTALNNEVEFSGDFNLKFKFETEREENENGNCLPKVKSTINNGMNFTLVNFFHVDASVNNTKKEREKTKFFRQKIKYGDDKEKIIFYHLFFSTQSLSSDNDAILFTVNITTTEEKESDEG